MKHMAYFLIVCTPLSLAAQTADNVSVEESMSLIEILETGGWPMYILGAMSVICLALVVYFLATLRQGTVIPHQYAADLSANLAKGKIDIAQRITAANRSPAASIADTAMEYCFDTRNPDADLLKELIEGEGGRQATLLQNQTQYLLDLGVIAPMVGLLGTVIGMLEAFNAVALDIAQAKPMMLAAGVSQALITTAAGLMVGIPAMIFYAYFRGRTNRIISELERFSVHLLTLLSQRTSDE